MCNGKCDSWYCISMYQSRAFGNSKGKVAPATPLKLYEYRVHDESGIGWLAGPASAQIPPVSIHTRLKWVAFRVNGC